MKVIGINGSPRPDGNTSIIIREVFRMLEENGIETELVQLGGSAIRGCTACGACFQTKNGLCAMQGDAINESLRKASQADGIILWQHSFSNRATKRAAILLFGLGKA